MSTVGLSLSDEQIRKIKRARKPVMVEVSPGDVPVQLTRSQATKAKKGACRLMIGKGQLGSGVRPLGRGQDGGRGRDSFQRKLLRATPTGQVLDKLLTLSGRGDEGGDGDGLVSTAKQGAISVSKEVKEMAEQILRSGQSVDQIIKDTVKKLKSGISGSGQQGGFVMALLSALPQALGIVKQVQGAVGKLPQNAEAKKQVDSIYTKYGAGMSGGALESLRKQYGIPKKVHDAVVGQGLSGGKRPTDLELFWSSFVTSFTNPVRGIKFLYGVAADEIAKAQRGRGDGGACGCDGAGVRSLGAGSKKKVHQDIIGWKQAGSGVRIL